MIVWKIDSSLNLPLIPVTLIFPISILDGNRLIVEDETTYKKKIWIQITNKHKRKKKRNKFTTLKWSIMHFNNINELASCISTGLDPLCFLMINRFMRNGYIKYRPLFNALPLFCEHVPSHNNYETICMYDE